METNLEAEARSSVISSFLLHGRTSIVSGGGSGIGLGVAQALAEAGSNVAIWYKSNSKAIEEAEKIQELYRVKCRAFRVDVTSPEEVDDAVDKTVAELNGRLDIFVANAGILTSEAEFLDGSLEMTNEVMSVNVNGVMWSARSAGRHFKRQEIERTTLDGRPLTDFRRGSFIATASMSGSIVNVPNLQAAYNASKAAVIHFCKSIAVEWAGFARVNTVSPGYILTDMVKYACEDLQKTWRGKVALGRLGEVDDLKGAFLYLASDAATYTTGLDMIVDGGYTLV